MYQRPAYSPNEAVNAQDERRSRIDQIRENSARTALVDARFSTLGSGSFKQDEPIEFGLSFMAGEWADPDNPDIVKPLVPAISYGFSIPPARTLTWATQEIALTDTNELVDEVPYCSGGVWAWERNDYGLYIGAYVFCSVRYDSNYLPTGTGDYEIEHYFTFYGTALKGLPAGVVGSVS